MDVEVQVVGPDHLGDLADLFGCDRIVDDCWCMWHLIRVVDFHAAGSEGNRGSFTELMATSPEPVGLLAYVGGRAVGWCATGPRGRYERAVKTPTLKGRDPAEDDRVWLVPCFFVRAEHRRRGVTSALLDGAVALARAHGAVAVEGFPDADGHRSKRRSQGAEGAFGAAGFVPIRRPSDARVVMRLDL